MCVLHIEIQPPPLHSHAPCAAPITDGLWQQKGEQVAIVNSRAGELQGQAVPPLSLYTAQSPSGELP